MRQEDETRSRSCVQQLKAWRVDMHQEAPRAHQKPNLGLVQGLPADFWPDWQRESVQQQLRGSKLPNDGSYKRRAGYSPGSFSST